MKKYDELEMKVVFLDDKDVITESGDVQDPPETPENVTGSDWSSGIPVTNWPGL